MHVLEPRRTFAIRFALLAALLTAAVVVLLLLDIGNVGAQGNEDEEETFFNCNDCIVYFCSHPGASRHADGSWLDGDSTNGDLINIHPTFGDYTESISEQGTWSNQAWGTYIQWDGIAWQHADGTCSVRASFRINGVIANADYWPCPIKTDKTLTWPDHDTEDPDDTKTIEVWEVRIWLNRTKVEDELDIECSAESPAIPIEDQGPPPSTNTPQTPRTPNNNDGGRETTVDTSTPPSNANPPPSGDTPTQTPSNNNPSTTSTPTPDSDDEPSQQEASVPDSEDEEQDGEPTPTASDDSSEDDLLEELGDDESDLMEQAGTSAIDDVGDATVQESETQTQTTRPRAPRTGTGGAAAQQSDDVANALIGFVASATAIGIVSLALYRRVRRSQSR